MRTRRTRIAAAALTPALLLGMVACGGDDTDSSGATTTPTTTTPTPDQSPETPEETTGAKTEGGDKGDATDVEELFTAILDAMTDAGSARISMNMDGAMAGDGEGIMHFGDDGVAMELSMPLSGLQEMTMRLVDGAMYAAMPPYTPKGKWFKIDADQAGMAEALKQYESFDPRAMTEQLRDSDTTVKKVGSTRIDGTEVTHYKVSSKTEAGRQTYDMFLDADSLVRRMKFDSAGQQMVMDFSDWGNAPEVKAPPKSDLVEAPPMPS